MWVPVAVCQPCELLYTCYLLVTPCSASYASGQHDTARIRWWAPCCSAPLLLGGRRHRSISPARRAHNSKPPRAAADGTDRRTDGYRTATQTLPHTVRAVSIIGAVGGHCVDEIGIVSYTVWLCKRLYMQTTTGALNVHKWQVKWNVLTDLFHLSSIISTIVLIRRFWIRISYIKCYISEFSSRYSF